MNFDYQHYVPILKSKRGEKCALTLLKPNIRQNITPLIEIPERTDKALQEHLNNAFNGLAKAVAPYTRIFLDAREAAADGTIAADEIFKRAWAEKIRFTPVTGITRIFDTLAALKYNVNGLALRVTREEFELGGLTSNISKFVNSHFLEERQIDIIIDLGDISELITPGAVVFTNKFLATIPNQSLWRTLTVSACAFPKGIGFISSHSSQEVARIDWLAWKETLKLLHRAGKRLPSYSDYAIQHPAGVEGFDPRFMSSSAAIRYTTGDRWLLIKGESTKTTGSVKQFRCLAEQLVRGFHSAKFYGATHCEGCTGVVGAADGIPGLGSQEVWRRLGTIHHLTTTVEGVTHLS